MRRFGFRRYHVLRARDDLTLQERGDRAVAFLERNLHKALSVLAALNALEAAVVEAERLHAQFRQRAPRTHTMLRRMRATGGVISLLTVRDKRDEKEARSIGPRGLATAGSDYDVSEKCTRLFA